MNIVEGFFVGNLGDDLFLYMLGKNFPNTQFTLMTSPYLLDFYKEIGNFKLYQYPIEKKLSKILPVPVTAWIYKLHHKKNENFILLGGSVFMNHTYSREQYVYRYFDVLTSKQSFVIGSNFGPVKDQPLKKWYSHLLPKFDWISWRDRASFALKLTGKNQHFFPDIVLGLDADEVEVNDRRPYVLINVMSLPDDEYNFDEKNAYFKHFQELILDALHQGFDVDLVSIGGETDYQLASELKSHYKANQHVRNIRYVNIPQILTEFKGATEIIATRYHAMILAWVFERPVHVYTYSSKTRNFITTWYPNQANTSIRDIGQNTSWPKMTKIDASRLKNLRNESKKHFESLGSRLNKVGSLKDE